MGERGIFGDCVWFEEVGRMRDMEKRWVSDYGGDLDLFLKVFRSYW